MDCVSRCTWVVILLAAAPVGLRAQAPDSLLEARVMVSKSQAFLELSGERMGEVARGTVFKVTREKGQWVWYAERGAWIRRSDVVQLVEAEALFTQQIQQNPGAVEAYLNRGIARENVGNNREALDDYNRAIELDPQSVEAHSLRAELYARFDVHVEAIADFTTLIELEPRNPNHYIRRASIWQAKGDFDNAMSDLNSALRLQPKNALLYNERGRLWQERNLEKAVDDYSTAISLAPEFIAAYANRGLVRTILGQHEQALADLNRAIELGPDLAPPYRLRGFLFSEVGNHVQAIKDYTAAFDRDPNDYVTLQLRGESYRKLGDYEAAIADNSQSIVLNPNNAVAYSNRGYAYFQAGRTDEAIADFKRAIELQPEDSALYVRRAEVYLSLGENWMAIADCNKALELDPRNAGAYNVRAQAWHAAKDLDRALADYARAIELVPEGDLLYHNRARVYLERQDFARALADLDKAIEIAPNEPSHYDARAWLRAVCVDNSIRNGVKAVLDATKACELNGWAYYSYIDTLAAAYAESGQFEEAVKYQKKAVEMAPEEEQVAYRTRLSYYQANQSVYLAENAAVVQETARPVVPEATEEPNPAPAEDAEVVAAASIQPRLIGEWGPFADLPRELVAEPFQATFGLELRDVERLTLFVVHSSKPGIVFLLETNRDIDAASLKGTGVPVEGRVERRFGERIYYSVDDRGLYVDAEKRLLILGDEYAMLQVLDQPPMEPAFRERYSKDLESVAGRVVMACNEVTTAMLQKDSPELFQGKVLELLNGLGVVTLDLRLGENVKLHGTVVADSEQIAGEVQNLVTGMLGAASLYLLTNSAQLERDLVGGFGKELTAFASEILRQVQPQTSGNETRLTVLLEDPERLKPVVAAAVNYSRRLEAENNLRQIGAALHAYHDAHGKFPGAATRDDAGRPLLSWRVALLPYLGEEELYKEFRQDEPWDSEHNRALISRMPAVFLDPGAENDGRTRYLAPVGEGTLFAEQSGMAIDVVTDGASNTLMILEADPEKAVTWTQPLDITVDFARLSESLGSSPDEPLTALFVDAVVHRIRGGISADVLKSLITPAGGEVIGSFE